MLRLGLRITGVRLYLDGVQAAELQLAELPHRYPFMLALSQAVTQRLLTQALERQGTQVERGRALTACRNLGDHARVRIEGHGHASDVECPWVLAADGAKSQVRRSLKLPFAGSTFVEPWHLMDVTLESRFDPRLAYFHLLKGGRFVFLIRVVADAKAEDGTAPLWRVIGNFPELLEDIPGIERVGEAVWVSQFHVSHRLDSTLSKGRVFFAGDAAHVHSPIGARGMNLGIEDAWVFSRLHESGELGRYDSLRRAVDEAVVKRVELLSRLVLGDSFWLREARDHFLPLLLGLPWVSQQFLRTVTGLDHPLPLAA